MKYFILFFALYPFFAYSMDQQITIYKGPSKKLFIANATSHCFNDCLDEIGPFKTQEKNLKREHDFNNEILIKFNKEEKLNLALFEQDKQFYLDTRKCIGRTACWCTCGSFVFCMTALSMYLRLGLP